MAAAFQTKVSGIQNHKAMLANAYNELGKELSSGKIRVIGNYTLGKVIGEGAYGKVRMGTHRLTSTRVAIKQIPKAVSASLTREIHHHRQLHHPNIMQMYEVIATETSIWIVTELCSGGELFDYLVEKGRLEESEARMIFGQLCLAVAYLHDRNIVHRDLKLENVLLDERCRVKLGDFGFTREYERGSLMETFCGTTGYASPEMLQGRKYIGPEVDVWSLGVILFTLLTGTLPFDDDDESIMRDKIIFSDFEDPQWLSPESRDLVKNILQKDPVKRLSIPQILSHRWFGLPNSSNAPQTNSHPLPSSLTDKFQAPNDKGSGAAHVSASDLGSVHYQFLNQNGNRSTTTTAANNSHYSESKAIFPQSDSAETTPTSPPSLHPGRTPARTKRRSMSSYISDEEPSTSPTREKPPKVQPPQDFSSLLNTPAPIIFSTPLERELLNDLSSLGFDTAQIVHSVLSDACDAAGALWWTLRRKAEKRAAAEEDSPANSKAEDCGRRQAEGERGRPRTADRASSKRNAGVQTMHLSGQHSGTSLAQSTPHLAFIPPTPTVPTTPPPQARSDTSHNLSSSTPPLEAATRSQPSTPSGSKDLKARKARAGSVSIMQRATTALEAAGIVRKKSTEVVRDEKERERSKENDRKNSGPEDAPRSSHGSGSSKLTKSPSTKATRDPAPLSSPERGAELQHPRPLAASPWIPVGSSVERTVSPPDDTLSPLPTFSQKGSKSAGAHRNRASLLTAFKTWLSEDRKGKRKDTTVRLPRGQSSPVVPTAGMPKRHPGGSGSNYPPSSRKKNRVQRHSFSSRRSSSVNSRRSSGTSVQLLVIDSPLGILNPALSQPSIGTHTPNSDRDHSSRPSSIRSVSVPPKHRHSPSAGSVGSAHLRASSPQKYHRRVGSANSSKIVRRNTRPPHVRSNSTTSSVHSVPSSRPTSFYGESSDHEGARAHSPLRGLDSRRPAHETARKSSGGSGNSSGQHAVSRRQNLYLSPAGYTYGASSVGRSSWKKSWGVEPPGWQSRKAHLPIEVLAISPADGSGGIRDVFSGRTAASPGDESDWVDEEEDVPAFAGGLGQTPATALTPPASASSTGSGGSSMRGPDSPVVAPSSRLPYAARKMKPAGGRSGAGGASKSDSGSAEGRGVLVGGGARQKASGHASTGRKSPVPLDGKHESIGERAGSRRLPAGRSGPAFRGHAIQEEDEGEDD